MSDLIDVLAGLNSPRILVVGDLMLDRYIWGDAERISPEAPTLILRSNKQELRLGGAASVAGLLTGLNAAVTLAGVVGSDANGNSLRRLIEEHDIHCGGVFVEPSRVTTTKERIMGRAHNRHPHQMLRLDYETRDPVVGKTEAKLIEFIRDSLSDCEAVVVSDYGKGVCTPTLLQQVISAARTRQLPIIIDPARDVNYSRYRSATILTPNRLEASAATGQKIQTVEDAIKAGSSILDKCDLESVLVTLDRDGIVLVDRDGGPTHFPTQQRSIYDITGAGDVVLAISGLCQAAGVELSDTVKLANLAAGVEVERLGVATVTRVDLEQELVRETGSLKSKIGDLETLLAAVRQLRRRGKRVVFTNGCFDLLHMGHISCLREAASLGEVLIVAVNSDRSVRQLKGKARPVIGEQSRAEMLASLDCVDHVLIFDDDTPHRLLHILQPDVLAKGGTYSPNQVVGHEIVEAYGGQVAVTSVVDGISTTELVSNIRRTPCV